jgi:perosamine synthetase
MGSNLASEISAAINMAVGPPPLALHEPSFSGNEWDYLKECLDSKYVSSVGSFVGRFENELAEFTGAKYAVAVVNGTAALHIALKLAGVKKYDEVLIPALTFIATANAVNYCNATPHLVENEEQTLGIDVDKLEEYLAYISFQRNGQCINKNTGKVIRAIVPMHTFGHPSNLEKLLKISFDFNIVLVEDAAESLGSFYNDQHTGTFGIAGTLSFNGNKIITTGGGGAILTNNKDFAHQAKHLTTTAKVPHPWQYSHDEIGYNFRMPNVNAALGCAQLEQLPKKLVAKRKLYEIYLNQFATIAGVKLFTEQPNCKSNYWLQTLIFDVDKCDERELTLKITNEAGIGTRPAWQIINKNMPYRFCPTMNLAFTNLLADRILNIPSSPSLGK